MKSLKNETVIALEDLVPADRLRLSETSSLTGNAEPIANSILQDEDKEQI